MLPHGAMLPSARSAVSLLPSATMCSAQAQAVVNAKRCPRPVMPGWFHLLICCQARSAWHPLQSAAASIRGGTLTSVSRRH